MNKTCWPQKTACHPASIHIRLTEAWFSRSNEKSAFTLIELLVVIAIVGVLFALFLGSVSGIRNSANLVKCTSNLRQIHQLSLAWSQDNGGWVPQATWYSTNNPAYLNAPTLAAYGLKKELCLCPAARQLTNLAYGINSALVTANPQWGPNDDYYWRHGKYNMSQLRSSVILFSDSSLYISASTYAAYRHQGKANLVFADGHVETRATNDMPATAWGIPP